jgi:hypothetical protein
MGSGALQAQSPPDIEEDGSEPTKLILKDLPEAIEVTEITTDSWTLSWHLLLVACDLFFLIITTAHSLASTQTIDGPS